MRDLTKFLDEAYYSNLEYPSGWINAVWWHDDNLTFSEQKELFFLTLKKLLDDDVVVLCPPISLKNSPVKNQYNNKRELEWVVVWDISHEEIIQYIRDVSPKNIKDENDDKLTDFWFSE
jgi:hypothetical protein